MALEITPPVFLDLMTLCLSWEWETAEERFQEDIANNVDRLAFPHQRGFTTVDKIVRILHGLGILTDEQRRSFYKNLRLQSLVLRHTATVVVGSLIDEKRRTAREELLLRCDAVAAVNRERMLRTMRFFCTEAGMHKAKELAPTYAPTLTRERYSAEIARQEALLPGKGMAPVMRRYHKRVEEETGH